MQRFTVPVDGGRMAGLNFGRADGPIDVVFLHATGFTAHTYRQLLAPLGERLRVVALDQRGHGLSTMPTRPATLRGWDIYARDVVDGLRQLCEGQPPPRLIAGHSMGGAVAMLGLRRNPQLAGALLLIDPAMVPEKMRRLMLIPFAQKVVSRRMPLARGAARRRSQFESAAQVVENYRGRGAFKTWLPGFLEDYVEDGFGPQPDGSVALRCAPAWESATFSAMRHDLRGAARAVRVPARMLVAEHGSTSARAIPMLHACAPTIAVEVVPGTSHFIPMEQPALVRERIEALLEASPPA